MLAAPPQTPGISLAALLAKEFPPIPSWIGSEILPKGGKMLFGGLEKQGKTFVLLEVAGSLSFGGYVLNHPQMKAEECRVLYLDQELGESYLQQRATKMYAHLTPEASARLIFKSKSNVSFDSQAGMLYLDYLCKEHRPNVIIADPLSQFHTGDENSNAELGRILNNLDSLMSVYASDGLSVILAHHFKKPPDDVKSYDPLDRKHFAGGGTLVRWADSIVTVGHRRDYYVPHRWWDLRSRWTVRHGEGFDDMWLKVNETGNFRVGWDAKQGERTFK